MLVKNLLEKKEKIAVTGMGYVGMPLAVEFSKKVQVIGYDCNTEKIALFNKGVDPTCEVGDEMIKNCTVDFTSDEKRLTEAKFHIIAVPTPINLDKTPDLSPVIEASKTVGQHLVYGATVVYESTVYPGVTEEFCIPVLEKESGLKCGTDFKIGYSPERINPGDKIHRLPDIKKIVSGMDEETLDEIAGVYELIIKAGVFKVSSIKVAEAAKVVENSQRDINIAFANELAMAFDKMGIDTNEVIDAMNTKWNALGFRPGLVGGHCIGVDPYYFIYQAEKLGYHSQIISAGRKVNDGMGEYIGNSIIKKMILADLNVKKAKVVIMGVTFKEDCPDIRNSKVIDIIDCLNSYEVNPIVVDPWAEAQEVKKVYGVEMSSMEEVKNADVLIFAVAHTEFRKMKLETVDTYFRIGENRNKVLIDIKGIFDVKQLCQKGYTYWRL